MAKDHERPEENQTPGRSTRGVPRGRGRRRGLGHLLPPLGNAPVRSGDRPAARAGRPSVVLRLAGRAPRGLGLAVDVERLAWHQRAKLRDGAFSTLLWVHAIPPDEHDPPEADSCRLQVRALGDSLPLFQRDGQTVKTFPLEHSEQFEADPLVRRQRGPQSRRPAGVPLVDECGHTGDLLALATDAIGLWAMRRAEAGTPVDWSSYWDMTEEVWEQEILALRDAGKCATTTPR